jgi:uncharacterized protein (DUF1330 family)
MAAYVIVDTQVHNAEAYESYKAQVSSFVEKYGGEYLVRGGTHEVVEGDWNPTRIVLLKFPDRQAAESFFNDPDYAPVASIRHANAHTNVVLVEGL